MPVVETPEGILGATISPSAVVWVGRHEAMLEQITSDGRMSTCDISRGWFRQAPFLAHVVRAIGDQKRLLILGPNFIRIVLERDCASMSPRPERLVEVESRLAGRLRALAA